MKRNYVLVDLENVSPDNLHLLEDEQFHVKVFVGSSQSKIPTEMVIAMQSIGSRGEYIQISGSGKNALDFHVAYYLGILAEREPDSYFHIISKDKGFDPLISYMRSCKKFVHRHVDVSEISILKAKLPEKPSSETGYERVVNSLKVRGRSRPRKPETLRSTIRALFNPPLPEGEVEKIVQQLEKEGVVTIAAKTVGCSFAT
ncbi:PIN domain-containing protein [Biformimicrobium ophioploci]|uniref:PIN domain-containing protein n=1 Tax=Biformimicrobium ophioploci TaxID=3036711 RepID=A0ABQ6M384_9GAMM|nr:PIN domain-containing protein [Microbulbifer sp. NKW57]GMG88774.1 PIN domain-containing protein [Microbulbifer sp. NKW57]